MKTLKDYNWEELQDAYGKASEIPDLLEKLTNDFQPKESSTDEPWFSLWSKLCHQGDVFTASYVAVLFIVKIASDNKGDTIDMNFFLLPSCIEIARRQGNGPEIEVVSPSEYREAIKKNGELAEAYKNSENESLRKASMVAILVAQEKFEEANKILSAED